MSKIGVPVPRSMSRRKHTHMAETSASAVAEGSVPRGDWAGFIRYFPKDLLSGFLVFLIALPLCLGISLASGFPAIAGVFTAIVGAIVTSLISNSELTIKGPAAGLIVIVLGAVTEFQTIVGDVPDAAAQAYRMALAVGLVAGIAQIGFGLFRLGFLGEFFPTSAVHGMLAAIGVIIMSKQVHIVLGVPNVGGEPLQLIAQIPRSLFSMNPEIALIGGISLTVLFCWPLIKSKSIRRIPAALIVVLIAVALGRYFDLSHEHTYTFAGHPYRIGENFLVNVPKNLLAAMAHPDFTALTHPSAWKWVLLFTLIGSLESLLSAKAIDLLDPWKRKTNFNRDMLAVGVANTLSASIGGLPMISEIVRSKANIDNGARTRFADLWHGLFLLAFVSLIPGLIHQIPLAALAAMLVYTGFRLAHPREFLHVYHIGPEQLIVFVTTIIGVLATDLLIGIAIGIAVKMAIHLLNGVPVRSLFKPFLDVEELDQDTILIRTGGSAVFSNWIPFKRQLENAGLVQKKNVVVDLSDTKYVDHSVMEKLHEMQRDFEQDGLTLTISGLDLHRTTSEHEFAARKRSLIALRRVTIITGSELQDKLVGEMTRLGASGYTLIPCYGVGRRGLATGEAPRDSQIRLEVVAPRHVADAILDYLRRDVMKEHSVTACVETVDVVNPDKF